MKATIVVEYGHDVDSSTDLVLVELDGESNLDSDGETTTQFHPGDEPVFLIHHDSSVLISRVAATSGMVVSMGTVRQDRDQQMLFTRTKTTYDLNYIPAGAITPAWYGDSRSLVVSGRKISVSLPSPVPCLAELSYPVSFKRYRLIPPSLSLGEDERYIIAVVVYVEAVK